MFISTRAKKEYEMINIIAFDGQTCHGIRGTETVWQSGRDCLVTDLCVNINVDTGEIFEGEFLSNISQEMFPGGGKYLFGSRVCPKEKACAILSKYRNLFLEWQQGDEAVDPVAIAAITGWSGEWAAFIEAYFNRL